MSKIDKKNLKKYVKIVGNIVSVLSIVFIIKAMWTLGFDFHSITNWPAFIGVVIVSVIIKTVSVYVSGSAWYGWLAFFSGVRDKYKEGVLVYAKANIGKYLPGNVMHYVERNLFADKLGISQKKLAASSLFEVLSLVGSALLIAAFVSFGQLKSALYEIFGDGYAVIIFGAMAAILVCVVLFCVLLRKKLKKVLEDYTFADFLKSLVCNMLLYGLSLVMLGVVMVILYCYMGGSFEFKRAQLIISGYIIAWVLGFIVPGAPGGIGVRELLVTLLLGNVVGQEMVVTLSVTHRLITVIGDFLAYLVMIIIRRMSSGEEMQG